MWAQIRSMAQTLQLTWILILTGKSAATVVEDYRAYLCCKDGSTLELPIHPNCTQSWTEGDTHIAEYKNEPRGCQEPCVEISSGKITLSRCANVTLSVVCSNGESDSLQEKWIHFNGEEDNICPQQHTTPLTVPRSRHRHVLYGVLGAFGFVLLGIMLLVFCRCRSTEPQPECGA